MKDRTQTIMIFKITADVEEEILNDADTCFRFFLPLLMFFAFAVRNAAKTRGEEERYEGER